MKIWLPILVFIVIAGALASAELDSRTLETKRELYQDCIKDYTPGTELHAQAVRSCALMAETQTRS
ncbi:hypothetical protein BZ796_19095 [Salmonella enterica subsp. enterica serovar Enteritidis]|nr:hypothetical protein [Salmonella enterica subsp. enterica serovar Kentucky]EDF2364425.1 hypothetical protein [Salmonella enterica subsp. enterica serovar Enteritidis]